MIPPTEFKHRDLFRHHASRRPCFEVSVPTAVRGAVKCNSHVPVSVAFFSQFTIHIHHQHFFLNSALLRLRHETSIFTTHLTPPPPISFFPSLSPQHTGRDPFAGSFIIITLNRYQTGHFLREPAAFFQPPDPPSPHRAPQKICSPFHR